MSSRGPAPAPELSLVLPLVHERGDVLENVRTWTHAQSLERERFQVVVATDGSAPDVERRISELLAPQDVLVRSTGAGYMDLYNVGVARAQAGWVVLTEAHVLGDPGCLAAVRAGIEAEPELQAAQLVPGGHVRATDDAVSGEGYFGWAPLWANRARYRPAVARPVVRALAAAAAHALVRQRRDAPWILAELAGRLPAAAAGALPRLAGERLARAYDEQAAERPPPPPARQRRHRPRPPAPGGRPPAQRSGPEPGVPP